MTAKHLGRYEIIEMLGRGSMGVVYKAHDPLIERTVAIKTVSYAGLTPDEARDFEQRFFLEAKSAGRLNHPNIVTIHDVGHADEQAYIAMEFLPGQSLRAILDSGVVLSMRQIAKIAHHVASGLAYAHAHGVIHRDIKPANIMVPESGQVKITDFGIALLPSGSMTMVGTAVGSPKYMAPEQVLGHKADCRSDIFSLGAVLYEMLTGVPPFAGADLNAILYQVLNVVPPLPSDINAGLPPAFDRVVARALAKDPDKRYQSADEMAADLRHYKTLPGLMHGGAVSVLTPMSEAEECMGAPMPPPQTGAASSKRVTFGWRLAALSLSLTALGAAAYLWFARTPQAEPLPASAASAPVTQRVAAEHPAPTAKTAAAEAVAPTPAPSATQSASAEKRTPSSAPKLARKSRKESDHKAPEAPVAAPEVADAKPQTPDWKARLQADIAACEQRPFFSRVICRERAAWKHCPGHWGTTDLCPRAGNSEH